VDLGAALKVVEDARVVQSAADRSRIRAGPGWRDAILTPKRRRQWAYRFHISIYGSKNIIKPN
jgi:hypothetical protein